LPWDEPDRLSPEAPLLLDSEAGNSLFVIRLLPPWVSLLQVFIAPAYGVSSYLPHSLPESTEADWPDALEPNGYVSPGKKWVLAQNRYAHLNTQASDID